MSLEKEEELLRRLEQVRKPRATVQVEVSADVAEELSSAAEAEIMTKAEHQRFVRTNEQLRGLLMQDQRTYYNQLNSKALWTIRFACAYANAGSPPAEADERARELADLLFVELRMEEDEVVDATHT